MLKMTQRKPYLQDGVKAARSSGWLSPCQALSCSEGGGVSEVMTLWFQASSCSFCTSFGEQTSQHFIFQLKRVYSHGRVMKQWPYEAPLIRSELFDICSRIRTALIAQTFSVKWELDLHRFRNISLKAYRSQVWRRMFWAKVWFDWFSFDYMLLLFQPGFQSRRPVSGLRGEQNF
jgi:hypothetical protein